MHNKWLIYFSLQLICLPACSWLDGKWGRVRILLSYPFTRVPEQLLAGYSLIILFPCLSAMTIIGNK